jgi:hemerythrin
MVSDRDGIALQHRRLDDFLEEILRALDREDRRQCETAAFRLQGAVQSHFDVEAQVLFPSIRNRVPGLARELDALEDDHQRLRILLDSLATSVFASDAATVRSVLATLREDLARHERSEESLLERARQARLPL